MTICIGMLFESGKGVVVTSDRMTTSNYPPMEFEHRRKKMKEINKSCMMLSAGDALIPGEIFTSSKPKIDGFTSPTVEKIADTIKDEFSRIRKKIAEDLYLNSRGITLQQFYEGHINRLPDWLQQHLDRSIATQELNVRLLVAGVDDSENNGGHIWGIYDPGILIRYDNIGYAAVGSGDIHALSIIHSNYDPDLNEEEALKLIYKAKKVSELAPGVGDYTDIAVINKNGTRYLTEDEIETLDGLIS